MILTARQSAAFHIEPIICLLLLRAVTFHTIRLEDRLDVSGKIHRRSSDTIGHCQAG